MRLILLSDTHMHHDRVVVPDGDVLIHAGDSTHRSTLPQLRSFAAFIAARPHRHKIVVAGNHDFGSQRDLALGRELFGDGYLCDAALDADGSRVWGSPWQPWFHDWAFNLERGEPLRQVWSMIPDNTDVLVTHGPPRGILDETSASESVGCDDLLDAVTRIRPRLHVFGHIHESYGARRVGPTLFVNASNCTLAYDPDNPVVVVDLPEDRVAPAVVVGTLDS